MIWNLLSYAAFLVALPFLVLHPKLRHHKRARLGWYPANWPPPAQQRVWLHGASAGDVAALRPLAAELKRTRNVQVVVSAVTDSGSAMAEREPGCFDVVTVLPYDLPGATQRTLNRLRPNALVLEYTEIWPQLVRRAARMGVTLALHNGRISARNLARYRLLFGLTGNLLQHFSLLLMRDEAEAERAIALGAPAQRVHVTGNTKLDNVAIDIDARRVQALAIALGLRPEATVWVAGSTHGHEEEVLLRAFAQLRQRHAALRLILAPRYLAQADATVRRVQKAGWRCARRSGPARDWDVLVLDTMGELALCYGLADIVFVGGSFVPRGGHNILEPAAMAKPVLFGPYMENSADAVRLLLGHGALQATTRDRLVAILDDLLSNRAARVELGELARQQVLRARGAARRNAELIQRFLSDSSATV